VRAANSGTDSVDEGMTAAIGAPASANGRIWAYQSVAVDSVSSLDRQRPPAKRSGTAARVDVTGYVYRTVGRLSVRQWLGFVLAPSALLVLWWIPMPAPPAAQRAIAISALMIVLWATEAMDHAPAGLLGLVLFCVTGVSSPATAFSGFVNQTVWFLFGAILIGKMASESGLAQRLAFTIASRVGTSYSRLLLAFIVVDFCLTFLIPSGIARVTILAAIVVGTVEALGVTPKSAEARGLMIVVTYTAAIFDKMIIAGAASILARGIIEEVGQVEVLYSQWFIAYLPADVITILAAWRLILWLYPPESRAIGRGREYLLEQLARLGPMSPDEKRCALLLATASTLWMTDFLHHLDPATIGLAIGALTLVPGVGVLRLRHLRQINYGVLIFTAAALGMSRVLAQTGGLEVLARVMVGWLEPLVTGPISSAFVLYWTAFAYHIFLGSETAMLSGSLPMVLDFARTQGLEALPVGMIWTFAAGGKIFAYQSAVLIVGYSYRYFDAKDLFKVGLLLTIIESLVLLALVPLYWPLIGVS
jgi:solute carrier family 13 (sodium-dependent dicarboxylate transporter), member 2/3/5